jgi:hypothetical protein
MSTDPIIGTWHGQVVQANFGTSELTVTIERIEKDYLSGRLFSEVVDLSNCNKALFNCSYDSCQTIWFFEGKQDHIYNFYEFVTGDSSCGDGFIKAAIDTQGYLNFSWISVKDPSDTSSGRLEKLN